MVRAWAPALLLLTLVGCGTAGLGGLLTQTGASEQYADSLLGVDLDGSRLGRRWLEERSRALREPVRAELPWREELYASPEQPRAFSWRLDLQRGQSLRAVLSPPPEAEGGGGRFFLDLFFLDPDAAEAEPRFLAEMEENGILEHDVSETGGYVLRLQGELLAAGRVMLEATAGGQLTFPVAGKDSRAVGSRFGDPRDGGRRSHEGIDIFAPRGTPAVAAVEGVVSRAGDNRLGGRVVWLRGDGKSLYYAHLDERLVTAGTRVEEGEPVGRVGNTGNARTTPPHLHFGLFLQGRVVDPAPWVASWEPPPSIEADLDRLGSWARVRSAGARLRGGPSTRYPILDELPRHTALRVLAATSTWYRVHLGDGRRGFIAGSLVESTDRPLQTVRLDDGLLRYRPSSTAPPIHRLRSGQSVSRLAESGDHVLVRTDDEIEGWMPRAAF